MERDFIVFDDNDDDRRRRDSYNQFPSAASADMASHRRHSLDPSAADHSASLRRLSLDSSNNPAGAVPPAGTFSAVNRSYSCPISDLPQPVPPNSNPHHDRRGGTPANWPGDGAALALPEFVGRGGCQGIYGPPFRAVVHPGRPASVELRPRPLRETQVGCFIRTIAGSAKQLWSGLENGVRVWNLEDVFDGFGRGKFASWRPRRGDEGSVPFSQSGHTAPIMCLEVDSNVGLVWSGHKDGRIRSWTFKFMAGERNNVDNSDFVEGLSWQAHRSPVLSMVLTAQGELWSGSEGGIIKAWSGNDINKSLSLWKEERPMACLLVERSSVDLRSLVTIGGVCSLPNSDVKYLLSDKSSFKVWSGSHFYFALWDSRTKELLKLFNIDGQVETRFDASSVQDTYEEEDMKINFASTSKKAISFLQRSRNVIIGAADAVRKAAVKGAFGDDNRRTEAIAISVDGMIWTACANGLLVQWDGNGQKVQEVQHRSSSIQCLCSFGSRLWVGYIDGMIQILNLAGNLLGGWVAHDSPIVKIVVGGSYIFTLANDGGIRGWYLASPGPLDSLLHSELDNKKKSYTRLENLRVLAGTWNVGQEKAFRDSLINWLGIAASEVDVVVVGLQEIEMGAGFLAMSAAKETVGIEGSANGQWWLDSVGRIIGEGISFIRIGSRQLAGLLIAVWARINLKSYIGDVEAAAVPCGFGRAIGNKGAVALRMRIHNRQMCFVNCHFAAHLEAVNKRNADFEHVYWTMSFTRSSNGQHSASGPASALPFTRGGNANNQGKPDLSEADMVIFLGDFNYRLQGVTYEEARDLISERRFDWLKEKDQLRIEMKAGRAFQGLREGEIRFPPTYKFEKNQAGLSGYDASEKKRIPAWCDRILYRDSRHVSGDQCSLERPVVSSVSLYNSCMDVIGSDHKPVKCIFDIAIAHVDESTRRHEYGEIIKSNAKVKTFLEDYYELPEIIISSNQLQSKEIIKITNKSRGKIAFFEILCEIQSIVNVKGQSCCVPSRGYFGFPSWLEVSPATGIIKPGQAALVSLQVRELDARNELAYTVQEDGWHKDTQREAFILKVSITSSCPAKSKTYEIHLRNENSSGNNTSGNESVESKVEYRWTPPDLL